MIYDDQASEADKDKIEKLISEGHPPHCAMRQTWGDGECECDLYKLGYDPYAWLTKMVDHKWT